MFNPPFSMMYYHRIQACGLPYNRDIRRNSQWSAGLEQAPKHEEWGKHQRRIGTVADKVAHDSHGPDLVFLLAVAIRLQQGEGSL